MSFGGQVDEGINGLELNDRRVVMGEFNLWVWCLNCNVLWV